MNICAVYLILNKINNKLYIGSAVNVHVRLNVHKNFLRDGAHPNKLLQRSWDKYGEENFGFAVLEKCDKSIMLDREQFWMDYTKCYDCDKGFNIRKYARSNLGIKWPNRPSFNKGIVKSKEWQDKIKIGVINSPKQFANKRNLEKWPHFGGKRCVCEECREKLRAIDRPRRRKKYNEKRGIYFVSELNNAMN